MTLSIKKNYPNAEMIAFACFVQAGQDGLGEGADLQRCRKDTRNRG